ncbi:uncharacterized protein LOC142583734 [Dermacentor variabilis]|uniref:uncharacterized protein LOC142583734 n=1 Tax=Dermacentor variabilis TaxID=34621 RepID=UPI003F5C6A37
MEALEARVLAGFQPIPKVFYHCADDCFYVLRKEDIHRLLHALNAEPPKLQFNVEIGKDDCLPFLEVFVLRKGSELSFTVHRKPTHTGRYLDLHSNHPVAHMKSVASSLLTSASRIYAEKDL